MSNILNNIKIGVSHFVKEGNNYYFGRPSKKTKQLLPGIYTIEQDMTGQIFLSGMSAMTDTLIRLPDFTSEKVIKEVEKFWTSETKAKFTKRKLVYKRGIILHGLPGCHGIDTPILMFDGSIKMVQDVQVNDQLMGPDSKPRTVLELARNKQRMVKIIPTKGESFIVNEDHILHLTPSGSGNTFKSPINMKFSDYVKHSECFKERMKLTRTGIDFESKQLEIDPYILGLWLGDGNSDSPALTTMDNEIKEEWCEYAKAVGHDVRVETKLNDKASTYNITSGKNRHILHANNATLKLKLLNVLNNKHIPLKYLTGSKEQRLELLAGLIDTDGTIDNNGFEITQKNKQLAKDIVYLVRSLGLAAYIKEVQKSCQTGAIGIYNRITISGDCSVIPTRLKRKQTSKRKQIKDVLRTGFTYEYLNEDNYYGFALNSDHLYLTGDFTIHHNTGKSACVSQLMEAEVKQGGIVFFSPSPSLLQYVVKCIREIQGDIRCLVVWEEFDDLIESNESDFLSLLDGEMQIDNVVYLGTTNYLDRIPARFKNRPSRFASIIEVGLPNKETRKVYLSNKIHEDDNIDIEAWAKATEGFTIDHIKDLIISVLCLDVPFEEALDRLKNFEYDENKNESSVNKRRRLAQIKYDRLMGLPKGLDSEDF